MSMTENGISTTRTPGQEQYEYFNTPKRLGKPSQKRCQYDYRHTDGELFSCIAPSLVAARERRDQWLSNKAA